MTYEWPYLYLRDGRLVDKDTLTECNVNWPSFNTIGEAENFLSENNIRATILGYF